MYLITALHLYLITAHGSTDTAIMIPTELPNYITMSPQIKPTRYCLIPVFYWLLQTYHSCGTSAALVWRWPWQGLCWATEGRWSRDRSNWPLGSAEGSHCRAGRRCLGVHHIHRTEYDPWVWHSWRVMGRSKQVKVERQLNITDSNVRETWRYILYLYILYVLGRRGTAYTVQGVDKACQIGKILC